VSATLAAVCLSVCSEPVGMPAALRCSANQSVNLFG